jgi:hypothetical protein
MAGMKKPRLAGLVVSGGLSGLPLVDGLNPDAAGRCQVARRDAGLLHRLVQPLCKCRFHESELIEKFVNAVASMQQVCLHSHVSRFSPESNQ